MKKLTLLVTALVGIALFGSAPSAKADWWFHRHHVEHHINPYYSHRVGPVIVPGLHRIFYGGYYYNTNHGSIEADVQWRLRERGYYRGPIDGDIGSGSRRAIRHFQRDHGLAVTGTITRGLLVRLGL